MCPSLDTVIPGIIRVNYLKMADYCVACNYCAQAKRFVFDMIQTSKTNRLKSVLWRCLYHHNLIATVKCHTIRGVHYYFFPFGCHINKKSVLSE